MMEQVRWQSSFQLAMRLNAQRTDKYCTVLLQRHGSYANVERFFP